MRKKITKIIIALIASIFANVTLAEKIKFHNPSFDCSGVKEGSVEHEICSNKQLSRYDRNLDVLYKILILDSLAINIEELRKSQKSWIQDRNKCPDNNCILSLYSDRENALSTIIQKVKFSDIEKHIDAELSACLRKTDTTSSRLDCVYHSADLWMKEVENIQKSIVAILEYLKTRELVDLYHKLVLGNENSHLALKDMLSKILYNLDGTIYNEIVALKYRDMIAMQYRELFLLRGSLFLLLEHNE